MMTCFIGIDPKSIDSTINGGKPQLGDLGPSLFDHNRVCEKMKLGLYLLLAGFGVRGRRRRRRRRVEEEKRENNRSWLLGDVSKGGGDGEEELRSVHSSFRLSFGSKRAEVDGTTVLLVNLEEEEGVHEPRIVRRRRLESLERSISPASDSLTRFSFPEIRAATRDFSRGRVLGKGALSCVFRGRVGFGRVVAIKRLDGQDKECTKAFCRELMIASSLDNPNMVPLLGFCVDEEGLFLVYKYVSGGSLDHHLHNNTRGKKSWLPWNERFKIAIGIARAVEYLHHGMERCVVHRDIKPSNILLSSNKMPKASFYVLDFAHSWGHFGYPSSEGEFLLLNLCDFGLATWTVRPSVPFLCKTVRGTFGYLAPEYFQHGKVSDKTDVYAFGVVLLELITGRKPIETRRPQGEENLVMWAKPLLQQGAMDELIDPQLRNWSNNNQSEMNRMVRASAACLNSEESERPSIDQVIDILLGEEIFDDWYCHLSQEQLQLTTSEMKGHLALAMLGVSDIEDDKSFS
ncbi:Receptor-like cytosolic serine/threonine-protein kinase RBK2 [Acorus calamus]|uniref:Receptor-like cytosolic serine/threonine-protein kinase RBK2 n=1 Tax=Acorus calamus TaxID=4465 RepID=A0AAV9E7Q2_ACOCL|nr:Receptor-like cytosolic serine/threonine-protein kinase RBK2 [Acorus calamus]